MNKFKIAAILVSVLLVAAACNKSNNTSDNNTGDTYAYQTPDTTEPTPNPTPAPTPSPSVTPDTVVISITSGGFTPANVSIKSGTVVKFVNNDTQPHWPASNPHPTHTDLPGFDPLRGVVPGSSYSYTFTKTGTWGYHDHLKATTGGKITVN